MDKVDETIKNIIMNNLYTDNILIEESTDLINDLGIDSVALIKIVIDIEEELNVLFPDEFLTQENLSNFSILSNVIKQLLPKNH